MPKNVPASEYTTYIRQKASFDSRNPPSLFNSLIVQSDVARGLPPAVPEVPSTGDSLVISGFSGNDYYEIPGTNLGTFNRTIECFVFVTPDTIGFAVYYGTVDIEVNYPNVQIGSNNSFDISSLANKWVHFALIRIDGAISLYIDGVVRQTTITQSNLTSLYIGSDSGSDPFTGKLSNLRVSNIARYTTNFTPSFPLVLDANTTLLLTDGFYGPAAGDVTTFGAPTFTNEVIDYIPA
jgi:hypothetical protein